MRKAMLRNSGHIPALEFHAAARWRKSSRQQIEVGALSSAVGADDRCNGALGKFGRYIVQRDEFAEYLAHAFGAQNDLLRLRADRRHGLPREISVPQIPVGKNSTQIMKTAPTMSCQWTVQSETRFSSIRNAVAPIIGPKNVPIPPSSATITTTPEVS